MELRHQSRSLRLSLARPASPLHQEELLLLRLQRSKISSKKCQLQVDNLEASDLERSPSISRNISFVVIMVNRLLSLSPTPRDLTRMEPTMLDLLFLIWLSTKPLFPIPSLLLSLYA